MVYNCLSGGPLPRVQACGIYPGRNASFSSPDTQGDILKIQIRVTMGFVERMGDGIELTMGDSGQHWA